jgi:hypothetical protein
VIVDPVSLLIEYMAEERLSEIMGLPTDWKTQCVVDNIQRETRHSAGVFRPHGVWSLRGIVI